MSSLRACPFCRELYDEIETERCQVCGVLVRPLHELPPSFEKRQRAVDVWSQTHPGDRPLPWRDMSSGRGLVLAACVLGLGSFVSPWISLSQPDELLLSGLDLASKRGYWFSAGALGWFINIPLLLSRRTINQLRGIRVGAALFASLTACQGALLFALAPTSELVVIDYHWAWGFYASIIVSLAGTAAAFRLGSDTRSSEEPPQPDEPTRVDGHFLH